MMTRGRVSGQRKSADSDCNKDGLSFVADQPTGAEVDSGGSDSGVVSDRPAQEEGKSAECDSAHDAACVVDAGGETDGSCHVDGVTDGIKGGEDPSLAGELGTDVNVHNVRVSVSGERAGDAGAASQMEVMLRMFEGFQAQLTTQLEGIDRRFEGLER